MSQVVNCDLRIYFADHFVAEEAEMLFGDLEHKGRLSFGALRLTEESVKLISLERHDTWVLLEFEADKKTVEGLVEQISTVFPGGDADVSLRASESALTADLISLRGGQIEHSKHVSRLAPPHEHSSDKLRELCNTCP